MLALLFGTCYVTRAQEIELGPLHFTVLRMLLVVGVMRVIARGEFKGGLQKMDWLMVVPWAGLMLLTVAFHKNPSGQIIERLGFVFDAFGCYFLVRSFCRTGDDATQLSRILGAVLMPIAALMLVEKVTTHNFFSFLGGVPDISHIRDGHLRAQGPFGHAILAGTVGAVCLPLVLSIWKQHRFAALIGAAASLSMVFASGSSGPLLSAMAAVAAMSLWPARDKMRHLRWAGLAGYVALDLVMKDPAYFVMARVDLTGGSTGWFRARLIQSSIEHLSEWWLYGTDYTRHWMPSGVSWSPDHTDVTDHYIYMGVLGGLPLLAAFIALLVHGYSAIGRCLKDLPEDRQFAVWSVGAALFAHTVTIFSVSYFDSSILFFYMTLGLIGSAMAERAAVAVAVPVPVKATKLEAAPAVPVRANVLAARGLGAHARTAVSFRRLRDVTPPASRAIRR